ncbi:uncharacterized protein PG986_010418 [Apiospora aurea]|uniref:Uncharacterized protein n=1 Tax=Apiospora aurea TaxID=335848 RepID=A0ABR1Q273_9PEZI
MASPLPYFFHIERRSPRLYVDTKADAERVLCLLILQHKRQELDDELDDSVMGHADVQRSNNDGHEPRKGPKAGCFRRLRRALAPWQLRIRSLLRSLRRLGGSADSPGLVDELGAGESALHLGWLDDAFALEERLGVFQDSLKEVLVVGLDAQPVAERASIANDEGDVAERHIYLGKSVGARRDGQRHGLRLRFRL